MDNLGDKGNELKGNPHHDLRNNCRKCGVTLERELNRLYFHSKINCSGIYIYSMLKSRFTNLLLIFLCRSTNEELRIYEDRSLIFHYDSVVT